MTNGEMFKEVFGYDLYCKECHDGWRNYEYKGSVHYHFDPKKGRYINDNPPFIPLSVIEKIRADVEKEIKHSVTSARIGTLKCVQRIIDKAVNEVTNG